MSSNLLYHTPQTTPIRPLLFALLVMVAILFGACASPQEAEPSSHLSAERAADEASTENAGSDTADFQATEPLPAAQALPPARISIPEAGLESPVEAMGWAVVNNGGQRTTRWIVPADAAGWHSNSVGAGASGNMILSGHQVQGDAVFVPLSLGDVAVGQHVLVEDEDGVVFVYRIVDLSDPIPVAGADAGEEEKALAYVEPSEDARLTLITGWPDFTTTHRVFAQAELLGVQK